jgi:hypothetical protein
MRLLCYIFALLALGHESYSKCDSEFVTYSPANPVEMWPSDCETYNEKQVCGIFPKCYNQPFNCDDTIPFQITDELGEDFALVIENEDGDEIDRVDFVLYEDISGDIFPSYLDFVNTGTGTNWTIDETPAVTLTGISSSSNMDGFKPLPAGKYRLDYTISFASNMVLTISFLKDGVEIADEQLIPFLGVSPITDSIEIILTESVDTIRFHAIRGSGGSGSVNLGEFNLVLLTYSYSASFVPSDLSICDRHIRTKIINVTASPEVEEMKSDYLDIQEDHQCTNQIEYTNNKNVLGLIFEQVSPVPTFYLRVHSVFFHERFPTEQFSMELTSGYERLSGSIKAQRLFETDYLPYYMHRKLQLIFMMQSILIDGFYWTQEEAYQEIESSNKRWPIKMANVYLTQRDFVQRVTT